MVEATRKAKVALCASKRPRATFSKTTRVAWSIRLAMRLSRSSEGAACWTACKKSLVMYVSENWYIGSSRAKSAVAK